ncbi:hypothetical protein SLG_11520 [Sphingobium sp. SYK-6]|uniref:hypothetical protein n=1 Tax=Sphingobium sp. (strain NBRC 103272 / SYK-6) TaxID=627192 RepID=UPI00022770F7|nr:hypothetical protein [Sphingobium sp. SYK-6]BAK65827.1 hypothetical protein SLG_11520 [Sphingobium sp. SYK-6]
MSRSLRCLATLPLAATLCVQAAAQTPAPAQDRFLASLAALCGHAYEGKVTSSDAADADMAGSRLVMHVRSCTADEVRVPFHVGEDRSRTWVVSRTPAGLRLKHDHRHEDGSEDKLTQYGGDTVAPGTAERQEFPADAYSRAMFIAQDIPRSATNVWAMEIVPGQRFVYELRRPGRHFRVEFDLTRPVAPPPPPWGAE